MEFKETVIDACDLNSYLDKVCFENPPTNIIFEMKELTRRFLVFEDILFRDYNDKISHYYFPKFTETTYNINPDIPFLKIYVKESMQRLFYEEIEL